MRTSFASLQFSLSPISRCFAALFGCTLALACSSEDEENGPGTSAACACNVTNNGASQEIVCGDDACVGGISFACGQGATLTKGGPCKAEVATDGGKSEEGGGGGGSDLTCESYAWCGSGNVTQWNGQTLPTPRGGSIPDGLYRQAYRLAELGKGTSFGGYGSAILFRNGRVRDLDSLGSVGTFTTSGNMLVIQRETNCDNDTGKAGSATTTKSEKEYWVDPNGQLFLFSQSTGSAGTQTVASVFRKVDALCKDLPKSVPATPGDSFTCTVTNCGCTEASPGPANQKTCDFVHGL